VVDHCGAVLVEVVSDLLRYVSPDDLHIVVSV